MKATGHSPAASPATAPARTDMKRDADGKPLGEKTEKEKAQQK